MKEDAIKMIKLLGMPVFEAKGEAESQCVDLVNNGKADAVASEDLDCLTFGSKILLRSKNSKKPKSKISKMLKNQLLRYS